MKGTERRSKIEIAETLESCGASLSFSTDSTDLVGVDIGAAALSRDQDMLLDTLVEVLRLPVFPAEELEKEKKRLVGSIRQQQDQTSGRAYEAASRAIYPEGHPFRRRTAARRASPASRRSPAMSCATFYVDRYGAGTLQLVVVGDVDTQRVLDGLEDRFADWLGGPRGTLPKVDVPKPSRRPRNGRHARQGERRRHAGATGRSRAEEPEFLACTLANSALGQSSLTSRLGVRVRDMLGLTYGIHSSFSARKIPGPFAVSLSVKPESRDAAVQATLEEIVAVPQEGHDGGRAGA